MTRGSKIWLAVAAIFTVVNLLGIGLAAAAHESLHTGLHVALAVVGGAWTWWLVARERRAAITAAGTRGGLPPDTRIDYLQQSVDAVALEVERLGEAQRFAEKLRAEKTQPPPEKKEPPAS